jgi:ABC-type Na+ efflux pump permease subunit
MRSLLLVAVAATLLVGCSKPEDKFVGNWAGKVEFPKEAMDTLKAMLPPADFAKAEKDIKEAKIDLELKKDKSYSITSVTENKPSTVTGTWTLSEDAKTLTLSGPKLGDEAKAAAKKAGATDAQIAESEAKSTTYTVSEDGKSMSTTEAQMGFEITISFSKK